LAGQNFHDALIIRREQVAQHPAEPIFASALARTLIELGDCLGQNRPQSLGGEFPSAAECYQQAAGLLAGLHSPPLQAPDVENPGEHSTIAMVEVVRANALEHLGTLLARGPGTFTAAGAHLRKAADEITARADLYINDPRWSRSRERVNMSLDAAKKRLELAKYEAKALERNRARSDLEHSADYLGVNLAMSRHAQAGGLLLKDLVPVNIDVRACLAEVYALAALLDASQGDAGQSHDCITAFDMCMRATQERLVIHELNPESADAVDALAKAHLQQGYAAYRAKGAREAIATFQRVREVYQAGTDAKLPGMADRVIARTQIADALEAAGIALHDVGNFTEARQKLDESITRFDALGPPNSDAELQRRKARALSALADNWAAQNEHSTAVRKYGEALDIQKGLVDKDRSAADAANPDAEEKRLDFLHSMTGRAASLGALGRKDEARADLAAIAAELKSVADATSKMNDARLLERLIDAHLGLARAWKSIEDWEKAASSSNAAENLAHQSPVRDLQSFVAGTSDTELMVLRAETSYHLWLAATNTGQSEPGGKSIEDWGHLVDQQQNFGRFYSTRRNRDADNFRALGQYTAIIRFAALLKSHTLPAPSDANYVSARNMADQLLKDALKFREFIGSRYPLDVNVADNLLESFDDLRRFYQEWTRPNELERMRIETLDELKALDAKYKKDSPPKLSTQMAMIKLYLQRPSDLAAESQRNIEALVAEGDRCAKNIKDEYPDAYQRWQAFRASLGKVE
jgi:hypothetical protein